VFYGLLSRNATYTGTHIPSKVQDVLSYYKIAVYSKHF
jgi:hypothetical protein